MLTVIQARQIVKAFVNDACEVLDMDGYSISLVVVASLPHSFGIPQLSRLIYGTRTIEVSEDFLAQCCAKNSFTPLRIEMYTRVRQFYLLLHPDECRGRDCLIESLYFACALTAIKGLEITITPELLKGDFCANVERALKEIFNIEATLVQTPTEPFNGAHFYIARMTDDSVQRYLNRYFPSHKRMFKATLREGDKGTKSNPFDNVYQLVDFIKQMEVDAHNADALLQDIEAQKYYYDSVYGRFRIHWASPFVAQYVNFLPAHAFFVNQMNTGFFSLKPNLYRHKFLYRGQSDSYEGIPCVPNLFRSEKHNSERNYLEYLIFFQEMELLIRSHPLVQLLESGVELLHDVFKIRTNYDGLAQHYYNKSSFLDLSSDIEVMEFFATTDYDKDNDIYMPHTDTNGLGVIYSYELCYPGAFQGHSGYELKTIGKQLFMRPGAQCGYLLQMEKDVDFKALPEVTAFYFRHDPDVAKEIFRKCHNGDDFFADDILQNAWKDRFRARRDNRVVSRKTVILNALRNETTPDDIISQLAAINISVDDYEPRFTDDELNSFYNELRNGWWLRFCDDIHFYGAEDELYRQALREIPNDPRYKWAFGDK